MTARKFFRYMMGTGAITNRGQDISRTAADLCSIYTEDGEDWIGAWVEGYGFDNVRFPTASTRALSLEEYGKYNGRRVVRESDGALIGHIDLSGAEKDNTQAPLRDMTAAEFLTAPTRVVTVLQAQHVLWDIIGKAITLNMQSVMWAHAMGKPGEFQIRLVSGDYLWVEDSREEQAI